MLGGPSEPSRMGAQTGRVGNRFPYDQLVSGASVEGRATAADGGSLGTFGRGYMDATFEEAAFSAPIGQVTEPVQTPFGLHLIQVESRTADSVTARSTWPLRRSWRSYPIFS